MTRATVAGLTLAASLTLAAPVSGQELYQLGFTLDGRVGEGWIETPLGVVSVEQYVSWWLTLRGPRRADAVRMQTAQVLTP